ncbi:MAG: helix-turn-helix transcriptional regulator [Kiritimatiellae bacterium]|nr:helix-turn-helix transcriptional regulator [Kiritimatiellia bacterium]MBO7309292.1 helix-turn-helix transcriptional regulator [Kiritimatiellia bacterium]
MVMTAKELGETIRNTRKAQGLTQPQLAMACGTGVRFIVDLEAGKETCQLGKALNVIQTLGLALDLRAIG